MSLQGVYRRDRMPHEEIDGVPIWYEEHGDPTGPPLVALHGGIVTFQGSFGDVLPWLTEGRRVIGVELQGHGHAPDTGRAMSMERFADDVAERIDRVAGGGPADVWASASARSPLRVGPPPPVQRRAPRALPLEHPARRLSLRDHMHPSRRTRGCRRGEVRPLAGSLRGGGAEPGRPLPVETVRCSARRPGRPRQCETTSQKATRGSTLAIERCSSSMS